jgi:hypothetical protein
MEVAAATADFDEGTMTAEAVTATTALLEQQ